MLSHGVQEHEQSSKTYYVTVRDATTSTNFTDKAIHHYPTDTKIADNKPDCLTIKSLKNIKSFPMHALEYLLSLCLLTDGFN